MNNSPATLIVDRSHWRLVMGSKDRVLVDEGHWTLAEASLAAERIAELVLEHAQKTRRVAILLDGSLCMTARFRMESARQARKREAMLYKIEEQIPVAAEDLIADFSRQGSQIYAIAVERSQLVPLVDALRDQNLGIELISPVASLAWEHHFARGKHPGREAVAWLDPELGGDLVVFDSGQPTNWAGLPSANGKLRQQLLYERIRSPGELPLVVYAPNNTLETNPPAAVPGTHVDLRTKEAEPLRDHALDTLSAVRDGRTTPTFDLMRGLNLAAAGRSPLAIDLRLLQLAALLLLAAVLVVNVIASHRYDDAVDRLVVAQEDVFRDVFPEARLPRGVRARLESELGKLAGARGGTENAVSDQSVLPLLLRLLRAMPEEMRFRLLDIKIEDQRLDLTGEVRDFGDADKIAASLRREGFQVKPPTTQRLPEQGVSFRLRAEYAPPTTSETTTDE